MSLVTVIDLENRMLTSLDNDRAQAAIDEAEADVAEVLRRRLEVVTETWTINGTHATRIAVPAGTVSVGSVTIDGAEVDADLVAGRHLYRADGFGGRDATVQLVDLVYGWTSMTLPIVVRRIIMNAAARYYGANGAAPAPQVRQEAIGSASFTYVVSDLEALTVGGLTGGDRIRLEKSGYMLGHGPHTSRTTDLAAGVTVDRVYVQP
ncbi:MAG: hypothetical protein KDB16_12115 [Acidimicrobiales bacterium]|nr:hypothetical protein [Acidimicrobiales bacterium]